MASTTPFLDLEDNLFGCDRGFLERTATRFVLWAATTIARKPTDRYRVATPRPPIRTDGDSTVVRSNDAALTLASSANASAA